MEWVEVDSVAKQDALSRRPPQPALLSFVPHRANKPRLLLTLPNMLTASAVSVGRLVSCRLQTGQGFVIAYVPLVAPTFMATLSMLTQEAEVGRYMLALHDARRLSGTIYSHGWRQVGRSADGRTSLIAARLCEGKIGGPAYQSAQPAAAEQYRASEG